MHFWWPHLFSWPRFLDPISWWWLSTKGYAFTSSGEQISIPVGIGLLYWHHTCHAKHCYRLGRHAVDGTSHIVCRKHHPDDTPTAEQILADHREAKND